MRRAIDVNEQDQEGLCYDLDRAITEGLYEELILKVSDDEGNEIPITVTDEVFEGLCRALDLGVNVSPGTVQGFPLMLEYVYDYGKTEVPA